MAGRTAARRAAARRMAARRTGTMPRPTGRRPPRGARPATGKRPAGARSLRQRRRRARDHPRASATGSGGAEMEWVETTGRSVAEAVDAALDQLGVHEEELEYEVLVEPKSGLFGRFGG